MDRLPAGADCGMLSELDDTIEVAELDAGADAVMFAV